jgi:hypothetical protein
VRPRALLFAALFLQGVSCFAADMTGNWVFHVKFTLGSGDPTFEFHQQGEKLTGTYHGRFGVGPLTGTVKGNEVEFTATTDKGTGKYKGTLAGDTIKGTAKYPFPAGTGHFDGKRAN